MSNPDEILIGDLAFNVRSLDLRDGLGSRIALRNKSSEVLAALAVRRGEIVSKADIMASVWPGVEVTDESLTQCISDIRRAIGDKEQSFLQTHIGKGYSLAQTASIGNPGSRSLVSSLSFGIVVLVASIVGWTFTTDPAPEEPVVEPHDERTRVAVLAFDDLSPGADNGYLSDGISEGIITELARYPELAVVARNTSFSFRGNPTDITEIAEKLDADFVVEGSMQKSGNRIKVTVQLINGWDGTHRWAHEFDREFGDYFDIQSEIVLGVASHLGRELAWFEPETGGSKKATALNLYLRGNREFWKQGKAAKEAARRLYLEAIKADPEAPYGYIGMSLIIYSEIPNRDFYRGMSGAKLLKQGISYAEKALALAPDYYASHIARGDMHDRAGEHEQAIIRYQHAAKLNPSSADAMVLSAEPLLFLGREDEAIAMLQRAIDINPIPPEWYYKSMSFALWAKGKCEEAVKWSKKRSRYRPSDLRHLMVAQACAGELDGAKETAGRHMRTVPGYTVSTYRQRNSISFKHNPQLLDRFLADLAKAGLPEG